MDISKLNSLVELYFKKVEEVDGKKPFLIWLKPDKPTYSWEDITYRIYKLTAKIRSLINEGDRCLILSENRPYWLMADIYIMNAGGISVPIFTTYSANDYEYILNDCKPTLIFVSNNDQFKKIKKFINKDVKKIITFDKIDEESLFIKDIFKENINEKIKNADCILICSPIYNYDLNSVIKNILELSCRAWENKKLGFICAAGGYSSYMSPMSFMNSLMLDYRCLIIPRYVYATGKDFDGISLINSDIKDRIQNGADKVIINYCI